MAAFEAGLAAEYAPISRDRGRKKNTILLRSNIRSLKRIPANKIDRYPSPQRRKNAGSALGELRREKIFKPKKPSELEYGFLGPAK